MYWLQTALLAVFTVYSVNGLTCLQCDGVPQPRFCSKVVDCYGGEYCGAMKVLSEFGEYVYNLGCHSRKVCENFTSTARTCSECCKTSLCNSAACGEHGYPTIRGPVCYNCAVHTGSGPCHGIDFCLEDETCNVVGRQLFSSEVFTSKCISKHACKGHPGEHVAIIGKRDVSMVKRTQQHTCDLCCDHDLCNRNCSTASSSLVPTVVKRCDTTPCGVHGKCVEGSNGYTCICNSGYEGSRCEKNINHCTSQPCAAGGTCTDDLNSYTCTCAPGFSGINCETDIDDCTYYGYSDCGMGTCIDGVNKYTCSCPSGFSGPHCETNIDDCLPDVCGHGSCSDGINSYTCMCQSGFSGIHCETNINECASSLCQNGGTCIKAINSYSCLCSSLYKGTNCEQDCYPTTPEAYNGTKAVTSNGILCQRWDSQSPHAHSYTNIARFPETELSAAKNYCRSVGGSLPWCLTVDPSLTYEYCGISKC